MRRRRVYALLAGLTAVAAVVLMLVFGVVPGGTEGVKSPTASTQEVASTPDSPSEGIAVHGHWTIEVRNPDGSLAERREFDNALTTEGSLALAQILARQNRISGWNVTISSSLEERNAFLNDRGFPSPGAIVEATYPGNGRQAVFKNLTVTVPTSGDNQNKLVLMGTATAHRDGAINEVLTAIFKQPGTDPPGDYLGLYVVVTITRLSSPVNLTSGQTVTVVVVISFS